MRCIVHSCSIVEMHARHCHHEQDMSDISEWVIAKRQGDNQELYSMYSSILEKMAQNLWLKITAPGKGGDRMQFVHMQDETSLKQETFSVIAKRQGDNLGLCSIQYPRKEGGAELTANSYSSGCSSCTVHMLDETSKKTGGKFCTPCIPALWTIMGGTLMAIHTMWRDKVKCCSSRERKSIILSAWLKV